MTQKFVFFLSSINLTLKVNFLKIFFLRELKNEIVTLKYYLKQDKVGLTKTKVYLNFKKFVIPAKVSYINDKRVDALSQLSLKTFLNNKIFSYDICFSG